MSNIKSAVILTFQNEIQSFGKLDNRVIMSPIIQLDTKRSYYIRGISAQLSSRIPNVYKATDYVFDNSTVRVKRNVADAWTTVQLTYGIYDPQQIGAAIVSAVSSWFTNSADPSLVISTNSVIDKTIITIVTGKLKAGGTQFCLDLSQSDMYSTLGFSATKTFITNGVFSSDVTPKLDTQGLNCRIVCDLCPSRNINGRISKCLIDVPLIYAAESVTEFLYPSFGSSNLPIIAYQGSHNVNGFVINFQTVYGLPMMFMSGRAIVTFDIVYE